MNTVGGKLRRVGAAVVTVALLGVGFSWMAGSARAAASVTEIGRFTGGCCVEITPDGRYTVSTTTNGGLVSYDATTSTTVTLAAAGTLGTSADLQVGGSPARAVYVTKAGVLQSIPVTGGTPTTLSPAPAPGELAGFPVLSPAGTQVAFRMASAATVMSARVYVVPVAGPAPAVNPSAPTASVFERLSFSGSGSHAVFINSSGALQAVPATGGATVTLAAAARSFAVAGGARVAYTVTTGATAALHSVLLDGTGDVTLVSSVGLGDQLALTPNGSHVVRIAGLRAWSTPIAGGTEVNLIDLGAGGFLDVSFAPDSSRVVLSSLQIVAGASEPGPVLSITPAGTDPQELAPPGDWPTVVGITADSASVVLLQQGATSTITRMPVTGNGTATTLATFTTPASLSPSVVLNRAGTGVYFAADVTTGGSVSTVLQRVGVAPPAAPVTVGPVTKGYVYLAEDAPGGRYVYVDSSDGCSVNCDDLTLVRLVDPNPAPPATSTTTATTSTTTTLPTAPAAAAPVLTPTPLPGRVLDTRIGVGAPAAPVGGGTVLELQVTGRANVPSGASAAALNVTVAGAAEGGYLTVWPCGAEQPGTSNLNYRAGQVVPNLVLSKLSAEGKVCLFASGTTDLIADVSVWFSANSPYVPLVPERILETRGATPINYSGQKPTAGQVLRVQVTGFGRSNIPTAVDAVTLNITGVDPTAAGYVTVWPCDQSMPTASNLNLNSGDTRPNLVISKVNASGQVCVFTEQGTGLIADLAGYFPANSGLTSIVPSRVLDTRPGPTETGYSGAKPDPGQTVRVKVTGRPGSDAPTNAAVVVLNVTGTAATGAGYVTVWPCGQDMPTASNLNLDADATAPNLVLAKVGTDGEVCIFTERGTHLIADLAGWTL